MSSSRVIGALCVLCAFTLTYKYFPGVENSHYYGGFVMKSLYPELMFHDPILGTEAGEIAPYAMTIYYALPKLFGELWLDDRFVLPFYFLLVLGSCVLIDRIAVMIGCTETFGRALILLLFLRDHKLLENEVNLAHQPDFHHSAFAVPLSLLVFWMCIARKPLWMLLGSIGLLAATTAQVVPLVGGSALLAYTVYADTRSGRLWGSGLVLAGILASVYVFVFYLAPPAGTELSLWEILKWEWYEGMVAPFELSFGSTDQILFGLIVVTAVCSVAIFCPACTRRHASVHRQMHRRGIGHRFCGACDIRPLGSRRGQMAAIADVPRHTAVSRRTGSRLCGRRVCRFGVGPVEPNTCANEHRCCTYWSVFNRWSRKQPAVGSSVLRRGRSSDLSQHRH